MKYLLFAGTRYYPAGGAEDFRGGFDSVDSAIAGYTPINHEDEDEDRWANIFDVETLQIAMRFYGGQWHEIHQNCAAEKR